MSVFLAAWRFFPPRVWAALGIALTIVALTMALKMAIDAKHRAEVRARQEAAKSEALDRVATRTTLIRRDQKEKENEVDQIPGSDQRLPDGYGRDLQRVRDRRNP